MKPASRIIKKYGNRRLYDTAASRYINLDEVAGLIRQGHDVRVVDAASGEDLTRVVLTQIITEDAKSKSSGLPLEMLRQLIVATDQVGREFIMWYLQSAFDAYHKAQDTMQSRLSEVQSAVQSPLQTVRRLLGMQPESEQAAGRESLEQLQQRIAELERRLQQRGRQKTRNRRAAARSKA